MEGLLQASCPLDHCHCQSCLSRTPQQQQRLALQRVHPSASGPCSAPHSLTPTQPCLLLLLLQGLLLLLLLLGMLQLPPQLLLPCLWVLQLLLLYPMLQCAA